MNDVLAAIKAAPPGKFKASGTGQGGIWHLALAGMLSDLKIDPANVPWVPSNGAAPGLQDLAAGGVEFVPCSLPEARALIEAGKVRALTVMDTKRSALFPDVPTLKEATGSAWATGAWRGIAAPNDDLRGASRLAVEATKGVTGIVEAMHHNRRRPGLPRQAVRGPDPRPDRADLRGHPRRDEARRRGNRRRPRAGRAAVAPCSPRARPGSSRRRFLPCSMACSATTSARPTTRSPSRCGCARGPALGAREGSASRGPPAGQRQTGCPRSRLLPERSAMEPAGPRPRCRPRARSRLHAGLPPLQYGPAHLGQRPRVRRDARAARRRVARPLDELVILAHSMGGLVARSACHFGEAAGHAWRSSSASSSVSARRTTALRSSAAATGSTVPRRQPVQRAARAAREDPQRRCHRSALRQRARRALGGPRPFRTRRRSAAAAGAARRRAVLRDRGDQGARGRRQPLKRRPRPGRQRARPAAKPELTLGFPEAHQWIAFGMAHLDLLSRAEVYEKIRSWLSS